MSEHSWVDEEGQSYCKHCGHKRRIRLVMQGKSFDHTIGDPRHIPPCPGERFVPSAWPLAPEAGDQRNVVDVSVQSSEPLAVLRSVLIYQPGAHPVWSYYYAYLIHLRDVDGLGPAHKVHPDATHEIMVWVVDPGSEGEIDPANHRSIRWLSPQNLHHQPRGLTDREALQLFSMFVERASRGLMLDTDFRAQQLDALAELAQTVRGAT